MEVNQQPLAMAYVPWQTWKDIYSPAKSLEAGTIFKQLDLPFVGKPATIMPRGGVQNGAN